MSEEKHSNINWMDLLWLLFLVGLALVPPVKEPHKQLFLLAFGIVQIGEGWFIGKFAKRGPAYVVLVKICLATFLVDHTGEISINSSYWPIYFLPVMTAAEYFGPIATMLWTALASAFYCSYLYPAAQEFDITEENYALLAIRLLFFFLAAVVVNRFVIENRRVTQRYQQLAETLAATNLQLEQAQAEARRSERLAALGQLSAGLAHEIRNPLGVIKGSAEMLNQKLADSNPLSSELAGYILTESNRLSALVTRFLDFARPLHADLTPQDIPSILDRALNDVSQLWKGSPVRIEKQYQPDLPQVALDEGLIEQTFVNIIQNAYDAMNGKDGTLLVRVAHSRQNNREGKAVDGVEVRIADSGPGISKELKEQIFNPFVTTKKSGVGLGLSIVSKIIDGHHGSIRVESPCSTPIEGEGNGACFLMFFPAAGSESSATKQDHLVIS